ncbi:MAG: hypothetical protein ABIK92_06545 [Pseudomonadota bacterium]
MLHQNQNMKTHNNTEVLLPPEFNQESAEAIPIIKPVYPMDIPTERFSEALMRREANRNAILQWIKSNLELGIDYGQIHVFGKDKCRLAKDGRANECIDPRHWSKPSLWKPGAEKICGMLGLIPRFPNLKEYENASMRGEDIKVIILKCELHTGSGFVAGEGTGARRILQDDSDINKSFKMAEKSAHIDATLRVAGLSELFTQDIEDMIDAARNDIPPESERQSSQKPSNQSADNNYPKNGNGSDNVGITGNQYKYIMDLVDKAGISEQEVNEYCVKTYGRVLDHISKGDASSLIDWLKRR